MNARPVFHSNELMSYEDGVVSFAPSPDYHSLPPHVWLQLPNKRSGDLGATADRLVSFALNPREHQEVETASVRIVTHLPKADTAPSWEDGDGAAARDLRRKIRLALESRNIARVLLTT